MHHPAQTMMKKSILPLLPLLPALAFSALLFGCGPDEPQGATYVDPPDIMTIAEARAKKDGEVVHVQGFLTVPAATFASGTGDVGFAVQDETAGIYVNVYDALLADLGQKIDVVGQKSQASNQTVITTNWTGIALAEGSKIIDPQDFKTGELGESTEGRLVRVTGNITKDAEEDKPYGIKAFVDDGSGELLVFVHFDGETPLVDTTKLVAGTQVEITGFCQQYLDHYEIAPRKASDLVVVMP